MAVPQTPISKFSAYDEYGFERPENFDVAAHEAFMSEYLQILVRRGQRWEQLLQKSSTEELKKNRTLKRFVRKGIPNKYRTKVWMRISGADDKRKAKRMHFKDMLSQPLKDAIAQEQIKNDLHRTFPNNMYFTKDNDVKSLKTPLHNVLVAFANSSPHIGYCQGLNYVAGLLLLVTRDEEKSFWLLKCLTDDLLPQYYGPDISGLLTDVKVLARIIRIKSPAVYRHVENFKMPWASVCSKWFVCLFSDVLPVETCLRLWDCLFYEGSKILLRAAITLILMNADNILKTKEFGEMVETFQKCTLNSDTMQCHDFINTIFQKSNPLPSKTITKLRNQYDEEA